MNLNASKKLLFFREKTDKLTQQTQMGQQEDFDFELNEIL